MKTSNTKLAEQMVFNHVARHLLTQNERADDGCGNCRYRTREGLRCAVGCLFDDLTNQEAEKISGSVYDYPAQSLLLDRGYGDCLELLDRLQHTHDIWPTHAWRRCLAQVACNFSLDDAVLCEDGR